MLALLKLSYYVEVSKAAFEKLKADPDDALQKASDAGLDGKATVEVSPVAVTPDDEWDDEFCGCEEAD
jgi:hypothetical protein